MFSLPHLGLQDLDDWWQGLCFSRIHQSILAVAQQLVWHPTPGRFVVKQPISPSELLGAGRRDDSLSRKTKIVSKPQENWGGHDPSMGQNAVGKREMFSYKLCFIENALSSFGQGLSVQCHADTWIRKLYPF